MLNIEYLKTGSFVCGCLALTKGMNKDIPNEAYEAVKVIRQVKKLVASGDMVIHHVKDVPAPKAEKKSEKKAD